MLVFKKNDDLKKDLIYVVAEKDNPDFIFKDFDVAISYYKDCLDLDYEFVKSFEPDFSYYLNLFVTTRSGYEDFIRSGDVALCCSMNKLLNSNDYFSYNVINNRYVFVGAPYLKLYQKDYKRIKKQLKKYELI